MTDRVAAAVIGGGVIGLAVGRALAMSGREVLLLERGPVIGAETSSRNSEVIHAGIYYPQGSWKARLCVAGRDALYAYCAGRSLPCRRCGKVIVATAEDQLPVLARYAAAAERNGAGRLHWWDGARLAEEEPEVRALGALFSPATGIIDCHAFMLSLLGDMEAAGGALALNCEVLALVRAGKGCRLIMSDYELESDLVVNSAGLKAPDLARMLAPATPRPRYAKGHYYAYAGRSPFRHLVYPVAESGGLGVHVTLDMAGQVRFGPDVCWTDAIDYAFDERSRPAFEAAIRRYYPALDSARLHPGYTGIRPKISGPGEPAADFRIDGPAQHGVPGLINLLGIESPGLTASLALADVVVGQLGRVHA